MDPSILGLLTKCRWLVARFECEGVWISGRDAGEPLIGFAVERRASILWGIKGFQHRHHPTKFTTSEKGRGREPRGNIYPTPKEGSSKS